MSCIGLEPRGRREDCEFGIGHRVLGETGETGGRARRGETTEDRRFKFQVSSPKFQV